VIAVLAVTQGKGENKKGEVGGGQVECISKTTDLAKTPMTWKGLGED